VVAETWYAEDNSRLEEPEKRLIKTTVGRVLFNYILPEKMRYQNIPLDKGGVKDLIASVYEICGEEETTITADAVKDIGFEYAMRSGSTIAVADITMPADKPEILAQANANIEKVGLAYRRGLLTEQERNEREIELWQQTTKDVGDAVRRGMEPNGNWPPWRPPEPPKAFRTYSSWRVCAV